VTTLSARADALPFTSVTALAVDESADTIEPSEGYANFSTAGALFGGETAEVVAVPL
jgi:hypothetical protein